MREIEIPTKQTRKLQVPKLTIDMFDDDLSICDVLEDCPDTDISCQDCPFSSDNTRAFIVAVTQQ